VRTPELIGIDFSSGKGVARVLAPSELNISSARFPCSVAATTHVRFLDHYPAYQDNVL